MVMSKSHITEQTMASTESTKEDPSGHNWKSTRDYNALKYVGYVTLEPIK